MGADRQAMTDSGDGTKFRFPFDGEGGKLVEFPIQPEVARRVADSKGPDRFAPARTQRPERYKRPCYHPRVAVIIEARHLECRDCGEIIDPLEWIRSLASDWDRYVHRWRTARHEVNAIEKRLEQSKRDEKNLKARLRNAEAPEVKEARQVLNAASKALREAERVLALMEVDPKLRTHMHQVAYKCSRASDSLLPSNRATKAASGG